MANIYSGDIKNMYISKLELVDKNVEYLFDSTVKLHFGEVLVEKDSEFYGNLCHVIVNFRYDDVLATREEAMDYLKDTFNMTKEELHNYMKENDIGISDEEAFDRLSNNFNSSILFVDYDTLEFRSIVDRKTLKDKKNIYKTFK